MFDWDAVPDDIANYVAVEQLSSSDEQEPHQPGKRDDECPEKLGMETFATSCF